MKLVKLDAQIEEALSDMKNELDVLKRYYRMIDDTDTGIAKYQRLFSLDAIQLRVSALKRAEEEGKFD